MENKVICCKCDNEYIELRESYHEIKPITICISCREKADPELLNIINAFDNKINPLMIEFKKSQEKVDYYDRIINTHEAMDRFYEKVKAHQKENPSCKEDTKNCEHWEELGKSIFPGKTFEEVKELSLEWMNAVINSLKEEFGK